MRIIKCISIWILIAVIIEAASFEFLDKYYFTNDTSFKAIPVSTNAPGKTDVKLSEDLQFNLKLSSNGRFGAYKVGDNLEVLNTVTGDKDELKPEKGASFSYIMWVPDSTRLLVVKKLQSQKKFKFYYYDTKNKGKLVEVRYFMDGSSNGDEVAIPIKSSKAEVSAVDMSTFNGVVYFHILDNGRKDEVYRMDRMCNLDRVNSLEANEIEKIYSTKHSEKLVYQDASSEKIYATGSKIPLMPGSVKKAMLLGVDSSNDTVYIGVLENEKIKKIYYGLITDSPNKWSSIDLTSAVEPEQLFVAPNSKLYLKNETEETFTDLRSNKITKYVGKFTAIYDKGIISSSRGILVNTPFEAQ